MKNVKGNEITIGDYVIFDWRNKANVFGKVVEFKYINGTEYVLLLKPHFKNTVKYFRNRNFYKLTNEEVTVEFLKMEYN